MLIDAYSWNCLPLVAVGQILRYLSLSGRLQATSTCRHWRSCLWQPLLWRVMKFRILNSSEQLAICRRLAHKCGQFVHEATFEFNSRSFEIVSEMRHILALLGPNVQKIALKPSSFQVAWAKNDNDMGDEIKLFVGALEKAICRSRNLRHISVGCISEITDHSKKLLENMCNKQLASKLEVLHIASIKEDPGSYEVASINPNILLNFTHLHALSIDYDHLVEEIIDGFIWNRKTNLQRLIIHVHDKLPSHSPISDDCWQRLTSAGSVEVTLNLLHSFSGTENLLQLISPSMPLVHFRAFFCGHINVPAIKFLGQHVGGKLKSFLIVDGMNGINEPNVYEDSQDALEDPFVMLAWKCPSLESFTLIGYEISDDDLIAIGRLRGQKLTLLDIPQCCIVLTYREFNVEDFQREVSDSLGRCWKPLPNESLHPSVINEGADAETFYLDILHSEQY